MNIVTIMSDEHSYKMMGFINQSILKTPNLDRLANESVVFSNCYTSSPLCAPARASFMTGQFINKIGTWDNATPYDGSVEGMSQHYKKNERRFISFGKTHFNPNGEYQFSEQKYEGFLSNPDIGCFFRDEKMGRHGAENRFKEVKIKDENSYDDNVLDISLKWLEKNYNADDNWHLYIGFLDPHFPFKVKQKNWDYYSQIIKEVPDKLKPPFSSLNEPLMYLKEYFKCDAATEEDIRKILIGYCCAITELDERIGILLDKIESLGIKQNTAVIYTSDHGEQLGYHGLWWKCCMFEESVHIPLIIHIPNVPHKKIEHFVNLVDIYPTACELSEITLPNNISGRSLIPIIKKGIDESLADFAFSEYHGHGIPTAMYMIRYMDYKMVYYCGYEPQLFHLANDPFEEHDLVVERPNSPINFEILEQCKKRLYMICNPNDVNNRAKAYQKKIKERLNIVDYNSTTMGIVPLPENVL